MLLNGRDADTAGRRTRPGGGHGREADTATVGRRTRPGGGRSPGTAFAVGLFTACDRFVTGRLRPGETFDVFLAGLRELAVAFGGLGGGVLACAFVTGVMAVLTDEVDVAGRC